MKTLHKTNAIPYTNMAKKNPSMIKIETLSKSVDSLNARIPKKFW